MDSWGRLQFSDSRRIEQGHDQTKDKNTEEKGKGLDVGGGWVLVVDVLCAEQDQDGHYIEHNLFLELLWAFDEDGRGEKDHKQPKHQEDPQEHPACIGKKTIKIG